jgi:hypothetical protein
MNKKYEELGAIAESLVDDLQSTINKQMKVLADDENETQENKDWAKEMHEKSKAAMTSGDASGFKTLINEITQKLK